MKFQLITFITLASSAALAAASPSPTLDNIENSAAPAALAEYNRIISLAHAARSTTDTTNPTTNTSPGGDDAAITARACDRMDPCCPNGGDSCVEDMCSLSDGFGFVGCMLGCCTACGKGGRYC